MSLDNLLTHCTHNNNIRWCPKGSDATNIFTLARKEYKHQGIISWSSSWTHEVKIMHLSMSSRRGRRRGIGRDFDRSLWPGGRAFEFSCCPGSRDIWIFVRGHDHKSFLGVGNLVIFDLTFLPGGREFDNNLSKNVKIPPYAPPSPPLPAWHW